MKQLNRILTTSLTLLILATGAHADIMQLDSKVDRILTAPSVAFNSTDRLYLAVWEHHYAHSGDWDIDGRVVDANGDFAGDPFGIAWSGSIEQQEPDVTYNPVTNQFLVAYALSPNNWNISGAIVEGDGTPGPFIKIAGTKLKELSPSLACDPTTGQYLAVYEREHMLDNVVWREVWAQRLLSTGVQLGDPYRLSDPAAHCHQSAVAGAGGQYLVVWTEEQKAGKSLILGRLIQSGFPSKTTFTLAQSKDSIRPQVVYNPDQAEYMVIYQTRTSRSAVWALECTRINTVGDIKGITSIIKAQNQHCQTPDVDYDAAQGGYIVTWAQGPKLDMPSITSHTIWALSLNSEGEPMGQGTQLSGAGKNLPPDFGIPAPSIATGFCSRSMVVWEGLDIGIIIGGPSKTLYSIQGTVGTLPPTCCFEIRKP